MEQLLTQGIKMVIIDVFSISQYPIIVFCDRDYCNNVCILSRARHGCSSSTESRCLYFWSLQILFTCYQYIFVLWFCSAGADTTYRSKVGLTGCHCLYHPWKCHKLSNTSISSALELAQQANCTKCDEMLMNRWIKHYIHLFIYLD